MIDMFLSVLVEEAHGRSRQMLRTAFGPVIAAALADPSVLEVMVNPDGKLWIDRAALGRADTGEMIGAAEAERIIRLVAAHVRREVTDQDPIVSAELPESGERFEVILPPVSTAPCMRLAQGEGGGGGRCQRRRSAPGGRLAVTRVAGRSFAGRWLNP